jgi:hypothetical protein
VQEPDKVQVIPEERFRIWSLKDGAATAAVRAASPSRYTGDTLQPGDSWGIDRRFPLTDDEKIAASTLPSSKTGLKVAHKLAIMLSYSLTNESVGESTSVPSTKEKMYMETPAILNVCSCVLEALQLPYYVQDIKDDLAQTGFTDCNARNDCCKFGIRTRVGDLLSAQS